MASTKGISGIAVAVLGIGAVLVWSGINNQDVLTSFRALAMGKPIPTGPQVKSEVKPLPGTSDPIPRDGGGGSSIISLAATYKGHPYVFGGGHRDVCPQGGMDCSGFVSCVLNKAGLMKGTLTTGGFMNWGSSVPFEQRQPGDIAVWHTGGAGHMGIIIDNDTMWHTPCTGCGGVQIGKYGRIREGRTINVRRPKTAIRKP